LHLCCSISVPFPKQPGIAILTFFPNYPLQGATSHLSPSKGVAIDKQQATVRCGSKTFNVQPAPAQRIVAGRGLRALDPRPLAIIASTLDLF
jgi:hypothetical protein